MRLPSLAAVADRARRNWLTLAAPAVVYLALRFAGVLLLAWMSARHGQALNVAPWDGEWYLAIAEHGYGSASSDTNAHGLKAFFPAYPWLVHDVETLLGGHYYVAVAAVIVSAVAGMVAAYGVARLARHITGSRRAGLIAVALFAAAPMSIVYSLAYPEALQCALTAWALVGVVERKWLLAGMCAAAAGLVRPTAVAVIAVVAVVAAWEVLRDRANWTATVAAVVAPVGFVAYYGWVANETGSLTGYFEIQRAGWGLGFDGGKATAKWAMRVLTANSWPFEMLTVLVMLSVVALLVISARWMPWPVWAYGCLIVVIAVGTSGVMSAKMRELLPAFVLLLPVAATLARQRATTAVCLTAGYVLTGLWIGAYSLTVWAYGI